MKDITRRQRRGAVHPAATRTTRRPTSTSRARWTGSRCASTCRCSTTRRRVCASGTCRRRTTSSSGATDARNDGTVSILQPLIARSTPAAVRTSFVAMIAGANSLQGLRHRPRLLEEAARRLRDLLDVVRSTTASSRARPAPREASTRADLASALPKPAAAAGDALEIVYPGSDHPRRTLRERRVAAGAAEAAHQAHVGIMPSSCRRATRSASASRNTDVVELEVGGPQGPGARWDLARPVTEGGVGRLGYRRTRRPGGNGGGFDVYTLRTMAAPGPGERPVGGEDGRQSRARLHAAPWQPEGATSCARPTIEEYRKHPDFAREMGRDPPRRHDVPAAPVRLVRLGHGAVDMNACIGCNACIVARRRKTTSPVVGKDQVARRPRDALDAHRPVLQGERRRSGGRLPADVLPALRAGAVRGVCPVNATVHDEGPQRDMVYNRCVGTRYCSNNCPYKVRRFNFPRFTNRSSDREP